MTRPFLHLRLLSALPSPGYLHANGITRMSPGNQFKSPYSYRSKPHGQFVATCTAQTSVQLPLALPDSSSHCLLGFFPFFFFKYTIAEMKATSKLRPPHPSAERPLQGVRGSFLSVNCPHADITSSNVQYFPSFALF